MTRWPDCTVRPPAGGHGPRPAQCGGSVVWTLPQAVCRTAGQPPGRSTTGHWMNRHIPMGAARPSEPLHRRPAPSRGRSSLGRSRKPAIGATQRTWIPGVSHCGRCRSARRSAAVATEESSHCMQTEPWRKHPPPSTVKPRHAIADSRSHPIPAAVDAGPASRLHPDSISPGRADRPAGNREGRSSRCSTPADEPDPAGSERCRDNEPR